MAGHKHGGAELPCGATTKKAKRQITKATFEKWQKQHELEHQTLSWLRCELDDKGGHVVSLHCAICRKYEAQVRSHKNFRKDWIEGSTNQRTSNLIDHATSDVHKAAMAKMRMANSRASGESAATSTTIGRFLSSMDDETRSRMAKKFDVCYTMAKESIPFTKYPALLEMESRHGVDIGHAYRTPDSAKAFTSYIARSQRQAFLNTLSSSGSRFFSFLMDGTTDAGNQEDEMIVLLYCHKDATTQEVSPRTRYLSIHSPGKADASGLLMCVENSLKFLGVEEILDKDSVLRVEDRPVLVGGGTDGASVNVGEHNGLKAQMQQALPWLFWSWCYAHRLELACKSAFSSSLFTDITDMLLRLFYIYEKSPKKSHELANIVDDLRCIFEFPSGGNLPVRSHGTRWITHKRKALLRVLDRYGAYIHHLCTLTEDPSIKPDDRQRLKGYLNRWKQPKMLIGCALYVEALKPVSLLSLTLQKEGADIVMSIENTLKSVKALKSLSELPPGEWPTVKLVKSRLKDVGDEKEYQGIALRNFDAILEQCKKHVQDDLLRLEQKIKERLEWTDVKLLRSILVFVETQSWQKSFSDHSDGAMVNLDDFAEVREAVEYIVSFFRIPLEAKGMSVLSIQDEVEDVVSYARKYLPIGSENYRKIWYKLHVSPDSSRWPNILLLSELVFSLPISTSRVEQLFSLLKVIKTKRRTSILNSTLHDLLEINVEGPPLSSFNANAAIELWWKDCCTSRRVNQNPRKDYRPRATNTTTDSQEESTSTEDSMLTLSAWDSWFDLDSDN